MKSWKIGAVAGLIAGIVLGIMMDILVNIAASIGLFEAWQRSIWTGNILVNIPLMGFWGIVLGIIYSRAYNVIPKEGISKGLIYGLILYFIIVIRIDTFIIAYAQILWAAGHSSTGFFYWLSFGIVLGILYESLHIKYNIPKEKKKIISYDMKSGIPPGAIAGFCGGIAASVFAVIGHVTGYFGVITAGEVISTIDYWWSQAETHILLNMIWGTIFGAIFPKVYNLVPSKGIAKGLIYGLIIYMITTFLVTTQPILWYAYHDAWEQTLITILQLSIGFANAIVFGLVLGLLYRKPPK